MTNYNPTDRRRRNELNPLPLKLLSNRTPKRFRLLRKLKHERTLQIDRAVQATRELKMTFQQRAGRSELIDNLFSVQSLTSFNRYMLQSESNAALSEFSF
jgi:hypothetical protein